LQKIFFHCEDVDFKLADETKTTEWLTAIITKEKKVTGNISYVFCSDEHLLTINKEYLNHDYYTDIITFDYTDNGIVSGDIFISLDRIKDHAKEYKVTFENELYRVIAHGVLHLIGYNDKTDEDQDLMTKMENESLELLDF
jgi:probable rRNA maturation factor